MLSGERPNRFWRELMIFRQSVALLAAVSIFSLSACDKSRMPGQHAEKKSEKTASTDPIENAMSAAPAGVAKDAAVVTINPDGTMKTLREGSNGFTCMPDNPETPGPDPMCMDANAMAWAAAWIGHNAPPEGKVGLMYMLGRGTDASNTDPYAKQPGGEGWVHTGPHVMVVGA